MLRTASRRILQRGLGRIQAGCKDDLRWRALGGNRGFTFLATQQPRRTIFSAFHSTTTTPSIAARFLASVAEEKSASPAEPKQEGEPKEEKPQQEQQQQEQQQQQQREAVSLEDFQHEEIVGPTVERDESAIANEVRLALVDMMNKSSKLKLSLLAMTAVQFLSSWRVVASQFHSETLFSWFTCLSILLSLQIAHILHQTTKALPFFKKIEERSRMQVLTLSLQTIKSFSNFLGRSNVVVYISTAALLVALAYDVLPLFGYSAR